MEKWEQSSKFSKHVYLKNVAPHISTSFLILLKFIFLLKLQVTVI